MGWSSSTVGGTDDDTGIPFTYRQTKEVKKNNGYRTV
jgi:hypothetical protein